MSENSSEDASELIKVESKLKKLQESFNALNEKYDDINQKYLKLAACHTCIVQNSEEIETQQDEINLNELDIEMIPLDVDQNLKDPIEFLPEHCAVEILKNLTGKELMTSMEVSKLWRDFINVQCVLMDKIVFKPTDESCDFLIDATNDEGKLRRYKHLAVPLYLYKNNDEIFQGFIKSGSMKVYPMELYASSLETAVMETPMVYPGSYSNFKFTQNFAQLQKLTIPLNGSEEPLSMLKAAKFPMLTYLKLTLFSNIATKIDVREFKELLCSFQKLQTLVTSLVTTEDFIIVQNVPKIKEFSYVDYCPHLLIDFYLSLERYEVKSMEIDAVEIVLREFKFLKSLSIAANISYYDHRRLNFVINKSIEALYIGKLKHIWLDGYDRFHNDFGTTVDSTSVC